MLQLNPMLPLWHVASAQPCDAFAVIDYSQEHDLMFAVIRRDGEIWVCRASELRGQENATLGRPRAVDLDMSGKTYERFPTSEIICHRCGSMRGPCLLSDCPLAPGHSPEIPKGAT